MTKARDLANFATAGATVSATELGYVDGVTSAIQTQLDAKQAINANVSTTELGYLDGVTSAIQTQLDSKASATTVTAGTVSTAAIGPGYMGLPQNSTTTGSYTIVAADAGKHIYSTATRTITIDSNANLALPVGTTVVFVAATGATVSIAITTDTLILAGPGTTGTRTLAPFGLATAMKIAATTWIVSGNGLT